VVVIGGTGAKNAEIQTIGERELQLFQDQQVIALQQPTQQAVQFPPQPTLNGLWATRFVPYQPTQVIVADARQQFAIQVDWLGEWISLRISCLSQISLLKLCQLGIGAQHSIQVPPHAELKFVS